MLGRGDSLCSISSHRKALCATYGIFRFRAYDGRRCVSQAISYEPRARYWMNKARYLSYSDFATILICPRAFVEANMDDCSHFQHHIGYEEISRFVPEFDLDGSAAV